MALQRLLILLFAVSTNVSASPVASPPPYDLQQGRRDAVDDDGSPNLSSTVKSPPILPVVTKITASYETTLVLNPRYSLPIPTQVAVVIPGEAAKGCTTTYTPPFLGTAACQWSGTLTLFPATTIQYRQLDCNGCDTLFISDYWYFCPNMSINKTERVNTPSTFWSTICRPTPGYVRRDEEAQNDAPATATAKDNGVVATAKPVSNPLTTAFPTPSALPGGVGDLRIREGNQAEACSTTHVVQPEQSAGKTSTKYSRTTTSTALLNCGGCPLVVSTAVQGYGPPVVFTTTTTLPVGTVTAYACRP